MRGYTDVSEIDVAGEVINEELVEVEELREANSRTAREGVARALREEEEARRMMWEEGGKQEGGVRLRREG